nr:vegetative cell wall protein gp1-like [Aegilops tauschii subsp. strangulata]
MSAAAPRPTGSRHVATPPPALRLHRAGPLGPDRGPPEPIGARTSPRASHRRHRRPPPPPRAAQAPQAAAGRRRLRACLAPRPSSPETSPGRPVRRRPTGAITRPRATVPSSAGAPLLLRPMPAISAAFPRRPRPPPPSRAVPDLLRRPAPRRHRRPSPEFAGSGQSGPDPPIWPTKRGPRPAPALPGSFLSRFLRGEFLLSP